MCFITQARREGLITSAWINEIQRGEERRGGGGERGTGEERRGAGAGGSEGQQGAQG